MLRSSRRLLAGVATLPPSPLPTFTVERYVGWDSCKHSLSSSDCEPLHLPDILQSASPALLDRWQNQCLGYGMQAGALTLREAIAATQFQGPLAGGHGLSADDVTVVAPQEGIYLSMLALLQREDLVVCMQPCYQSLFSVAESIGCKVRGWNPRQGPQKGEGNEASGSSESSCTTTASSPYKFDVDDLEHIFKTSASPPKLVVLNAPHNPTGANLTRDELERVAALCERHGAYLFNDEMYRGLEHTGCATLPAVSCLGYERSISLGGLSKTHALAGIRVGWTATPCEALTARIRQLKDYTTIATASPSELLAEMALESSDVFVDRSRSVVSESLAAVRKFVHDQPELSWREPQAGTFCLVRLGDGDFSASAYATSLLERTGIMLLPSSLFNFGDSHVRLCFARQDTPELLGMWANDLQAHGLQY